MATISSHLPCFNGEQAQAAARTATAGRSTLLHDFEVTRGRIVAESLGAPSQRANATRDLLRLYEMNIDHVNPLVPFERRDSLGKLMLCVSFILRAAIGALTADMTAWGWSLVVGALALGLACLEYAGPWLLATCGEHAPQWYSVAR